MFHYWYGPVGGFGLFSWIPALLFWFLIFIVILRIFRHPDHRWMNPQSKTPIEIIKERYAKGEIDKKQFEEMKKDLGEK